MQKIRFIMTYEQLIKLYYYARLTNCKTVKQLAEHLEKTGKTVKDIIQ